MPQHQRLTRPPLHESENRAYQQGETGKIRYEVLEYCVGSGLDCGCGSFKIHKNAIGLDGRPEWNGIPSQMNIAADVRKLEMFAADAFDFVYSSHCLEDMDEPFRVLKRWWEVLKVGGHLVLYLPHPDLYQAAMLGDKHGANQHHKVAVYPETLDGWMDKLPGGWECLRHEIRGERDEYSFLVVYRKMAGKKKVKTYLEPKPEKTVGIVRYGGQGDHIMTRAILPVLKEQGYHITYITNPNGKTFLEGEPLIDAFITDSASLSDVEIRQFWDTLQPRFDRFINMMNSVENVTLPQPTQANYWLSESLRRSLFNLPYMVTTFAQAELDMPERPLIGWTPPKKAREWAEMERKKLNGSHVVVLALAGSAPHKVHPRWPRVVSLILSEDPKAVVVSVGGAKEEVLYKDFPEDPRHLRMAGKWDVVQSYAFAQVADVVLGPETGILSAVCQQPEVAKVLLLSHSSEEQLCANWDNYTALKAEDVPCAPCHRLHWSMDHCNKDEATGGALCAANIDPVDIAEAVVRYTRRMERKEAA